MTQHTPPPVLQFTLPPCPLMLMACFYLIRDLYDLCTQNYVFARLQKRGRPKTPSYIGNARDGDTHDRN